MTAWAFWPDPAPSPATEPAVIAAEPASVRVLRPVMTDADSALSLPFINAIEASLVRAGARVFNSSSTSAQPMFVLESSVQRSGNRARVNVRLIDPDPTVPVWARQFDFAMDSVFAAQDSVAARVSDAVVLAQLRRRG